MGRNVLNPADHLHSHLHPIERYKLVPPADMSAIVDRLDSVISYLANKADTPSIDYLNLVVSFGWIQTLFEVALLYVIYPLPLLYSNVHHVSYRHIRQTAC